MECDGFHTGPPWMPPLPRPTIALAELERIADLPDEYTYAIVSEHVDLAELARRVMDGR
jgi:hypothetical protein